MILDIIFIRHAQSCANIWKPKSKIKQFTYKDPEITEDGIKTSARLSLILQAKIKKLWNEAPYSVGASQMLRAQETAYYMIAKDKPIHIIPHVAEAGITSDNIAFLKDKQREIIKARNYKILESLDKGIDSREKQTIYEKSNLKLFLKWAKNNPNSFAKGPDNIYRAVIFTHSHFLQNSFGLSKSDKIKNNNGIHAIINDNNTISKATRIDIGNTINTGEPDKCRISPQRNKNKNTKINKNKNTNINKNTTRKRSCKKFMNNDDLLMNYNQHTYKEHLQDLISYSQNST